MIYMYELKRTECYAKLKNLIQERDISQCSLFINIIKEFRHNKTRSRQKVKFDRLISKSDRYFHNYSSFGTFGWTHVFSRHSNNTSTHHNAGANTTAPTTTTTTVSAPTTPSTIHNPAANGSSTYPPPLTPVQEALLAMGPNFAVVPPRETYITAVEDVCTRLPPQGSRGT